MTDILVTGATGFIGSHTVRCLNQRGARPRVLIRPTSKRDNLSNLDVEIFEGDLIEPGDCHRALDGVEQLVHIAGFVSSKPAHKGRLMADNAVATHTMMAAALQQGIERVIYLGSVTALGASKKPELFDPATTAYDLGGKGVPYFESKRLAEQAVRKFVDQGLPVIGVYPSYCLGPGDIYLSSATLVTEFLKGNIPFVTRAGMGFVDVRDAAEALVLAMEKGQVGERYFISGHNLTYGAFFQALAEVSGRRPPRLVMPRSLLWLLCAVGEKVTDGAVLSRAFYMAMARYYWYDNTKAERELGWTYRPLAETLRDSVHWLKAAGFVE